MNTVRATLNFMVDDSRKEKEWSASDKNAIEGAFFVAPSIDSGWQLEWNYDP